MQIGINAMSLITAMRDDFEGSLKHLKEGGCDFLEVMSDWGAKTETIAFYAGLTGGPSGWDPDNTEKRMEIMKPYGLSVKGMFVFDAIILEQAEELGRYCSKNHIEYVVLSFLDYAGIDDIYEKIGLIKSLHKILKEYDVQIVIHNHEHDVLPILDKDGTEKPILDVFLQQLTPEELMLEIDTGWLRYAGINEAEYVERNLDRIAILHLKDLCKGFESMPREDVFIPCGEGCVDFEGVIRAGRKKKDMIFVLDQDDSKGDIIEDQITSLRYIKSLF